MNRKAVFHLLPGASLVVVALLFAFVSPALASTAPQAEFEGPDLLQTPEPPDVQPEPDTDPEIEVIPETGEEETEVDVNVFLDNWVVWAILGIAVLALLIAIFTRAGSPPPHYHDHDHDH